MPKMKLTLSTMAVGLFMGAGVLAATTSTASAYMACNHDGDCWHTDKKVAAPGVRFDYHPDDWYFHQKWDGNDRHYRDYHEGRGYYKGGLWITL
jgi:hypothetical protein